MDNKTLLIGAGVLLAAGAAYYIWRKQNPVPAVTPVISVTPLPTGTQTPGAISTSSKIAAAGTAAKGILDSIASLFKPKTVSGLGLTDEEVGRFI